MLTKIKKWGNSQGIRFSRGVLREIHIAIGDDVDVSVHQGEIIVKPVNANRNKYSLRALLSKMPENHHPEEENWGNPVGKEIW